MSLKTIIQCFVIVVILGVTGILLKQCSEVKQFDTRELSYPEQFMKYLLNSRDSYRNKF